MKAEAKEENLSSESFTRDETIKKLRSLISAGGSCIGHSCSTCPINFYWKDETCSFSFVIDKSKELLKIEEQKIILEII